MREQNLSKAELSRRSGVPYHTLDKFLKGSSAKTSHENATALLRALGLSAEDGDFDELRQIYHDLSPEMRRFALAAIRGLRDGSDKQDP